MVNRTPAIPPIPPQTLQQTQSVFGQEHPLLMIGNRLDELLNCPGEWTGSSTCEPVSGGYLLSTPCLSLVTVMQYLEGMTDRQVANAVRSRLDWKYALHLPQVNFGIAEPVLCQMRRRLQHDAEQRQIFYRMLARVRDANLFPHGAWETDDSLVLRKVCLRNRHEWLSQAFMLTLSTLAASEPDWMRQNSQPCWYTRYGKNGSLQSAPQTLEKMEAALGSIGEDARTLLAAMENRPDSQSASHLLRVLRQVYERQFQEDRETRAMRQYCSLCDPRIL